MRTAIALLLIPRLNIKPIESFILGDRKSALSKKSNTSRRLARCKQWVFGQYKAHRCKSGKTIGTLYGLMSDIGRPTFYQKALFAGLG